MVALGACSDSDPEPNESAEHGDGATHDAAMPGDAAPDDTEPAPPKHYEEVMGYDWEIEAGVEQYYCVYQTLTEDLWISDFRPIAPQGTHHVTLGFVEGGGPDEVIEAGDEDTDRPCNGVTLGDNLAYGAVVGTQAFSLPEGIAVKIPAGKQLLLSVHVFNTTTETLSGRTGIEIVERDPETVEHQAENVFANNVGIQVEPGSSTQRSTCTMDADATILAVLHHMHLTGVHMKTSVVPAEGEPFALLDEPFNFDRQEYVMLDEPVEMKSGDKLEIECQFENLTDQTLTFGESTDRSEMCLTSFYRYPAVAENFNCLL